MKIVKMIGKILLCILGVVLSFIIIFTIFSTWNQTLRTSSEKIKQEEKLGNHFKMVSVHGKHMSTYIEGNGGKTIVLLSGLGTPSPIADFMPLADKLSSDYKVVILEYFGYGFSDLTKDSRSDANIVNEIRTALKELKVNPPYILMPHSISGIYSMYYAKKYPNEVSSIIGIDESMPNQAKDADDKVPSWLPLLNKTGIVRDILWISPDFIVGDLLQGMKGYSKDQIDLIKIAECWNGANLDVIHENNTVYENCKELFNEKYSKKLPVLSILATDSQRQMKTWKALHGEAITNSNIQKIEMIHGKHYLHHTCTDWIAESAKNFIQDTVK